MEPKQPFWYTKQGIATLFLVLLAVFVFLAFVTGSWVI